MQILDIQKHIIQPENILPDGTMDPTKSHWCFGGTIYKVEYTMDHTVHGTRRIELQKLDELWHEPTYNYANADIREVIRLTHEADEGMYEWYKLQSEALV